MPMTRRTFGELKRLAREYLTGNYMTPILAAILSALLPALLLSLFPFHPEEGLTMELACYLLASLIVSILSALLGIGLLRLHLRLARRQEVSVSDLFWPFRNEPDRYILGILLLTVLAALPVLPLVILAWEPMTAGGTRSLTFYLCITAAIILIALYELWLTLTYSLIFLLYLEQPDLRVLDGFRSSRRMMRGNKLRMLLLIVSFLGWGVLGLLSLGIGFLWIQPYFTQTIANLYLDITGGICEHIDAVV